MAKKFVLLKVPLKIFVLALSLAGFFIFGSKIKAGTISYPIISEIQITGGAGQTADDFIELYNPLDSAINLKGYRLVKRTKTGAKDVNIKSWVKDEFIPAKSFYLWANSNYASIPIIPDATTTAVISDDNGIAVRFGEADEGEIIDSLTWGEAKNIFAKSAVFSGNPAVGQSMEKNLSTGIFALQINPNPQNSKSSNGLLKQSPAETSVEEKISPSESAPINRPAQSFYSPSDVVINEIVPDPSDEDVEWIELYNNSGQKIDLNYWTIEDNTKKPKELSNLSIETDSYLVLNKEKEFKFSLNNEGDVIILKDFNGKIIDQLSYGSFDDGEISDNALKTSDPYSLARISDGYDTDNDLNDFKSTTPTKGIANIIAINRENKKQDKETHLEEIIINEFLPNPTGEDSENEFIELKNLGSKEVNLSGWQISDSSKTVYTINSKDFSTTTVAGGGYFVVYRRQSKIALNNSGAENVSLLSYSGVLIDSVEYNSLAAENQSFSRDENGKWQWSMEPTPFQKNIVSQANHTPEAIIEAPAKAEIGEEIIFDGSDSYDLDGDKLSYLWMFENGATDDRVNTKYTFQKAGIYSVILKVRDEKGDENTTKTIINISDVQNIDHNNAEQKTEISAFEQKNINSSPKEKLNSGKAKVVEIDLKKVKNLQIGSLVKTKGVVSVEPGILGSQFFYLAGSGIQVYCHKKDFLNIKIGDFIEVDGEISESSNEKRIKIKSKENLKILKRGQSVSPEKVKIKEIGEELRSSLIKVEGHLIEKTGDNLYIDDGSGEIEVYIKESTGIKISDEMKEGDYMEITGILRKTKNGYQILPRRQEDITIIKRVDSLKYLAGGVVDISKIKNQNPMKYLFIIIAVLAIISINFIFRKKIIQ